jgi:hypothetical protein
MRAKRARSSKPIARSALRAARARENDKETSKTASKSRKFSGGRASRQVLTGRQPMPRTSPAGWRCAWARTPAPHTPPKPNTSPTLTRRCVVCCGGLVGAGWLGLRLVPRPKQLVPTMWSGRSPPRSIMRMRRAPARVCASRVRRTCTYGGRRTAAPHSATAQRLDRHMTYERRPLTLNK